MSWTGKNTGLTENTDYTVDLGTNEAGQRTTKLTLIDVTNADPAGDYTCNFIYATDPNYEKEIKLHVRCKCEFGLYNIHRFCEENCIIVIVLNETELDS